MQARRALIREWTEDDDASLEAILAVRRVWAERRGRVTLGDLGLDARLVTFVVSGLCSRHGQFVTEWTGRTTDAPPLEARCPASERGRCAMLAPVFVLI